MAQAARRFLPVFQANSVGVQGQAMPPGVDDQVVAVSQAVAAALASGGGVPPGLGGHPGGTLIGWGHMPGGGQADVARGLPAHHSVGQACAESAGGSGRRSSAIPEDWIDPVLRRDVVGRSSETQALEEDGMAPARGEAEGASRGRDNSGSDVNRCGTEDLIGDEVEEMVQSLPPAQREAVKRLARAEAQRAVSEVLADIRRGEQEASQAHTQLPKPRVPIEVQRAVRAVMRELMGMEDSNPIGLGRRMRRRLPLPDAASRAEEAQDSDNLPTPLFTPDWDKRVDEDENLAFITAVRAIIREKGVSIYGLTGEWAEDDDLVVRAAHTYFQTLRRQYAAEHDEEAGMKLSKKKHADKHKGRRRRKAQRLRNGIIAFRRVFGKAATEGVNELILSDDQSSEASSDGHAPPSKREQMRDAVSAGSTALEVRYMRWRCRQLTLISLALAVFARFQAERAHAGIIDRSSEEYSPEEREAYLAQLRRAIEKWPTVLQGRDLQYNRFRGPVENHQDLPRLNRRKTPLYKECISRKWAKESLEHAHILEAAPHCPASFTVLGLKIPLDILPRLDREYVESLETDTDDDLMETEDFGEGEEVLEG
ncbi:hypothetical protein C8Q77DRAFT_1157998 [Trametes polyzona]|nr:hypothetical protein C8Q77DRAFT_1161401 [Trametes polyzona]KAI0633857.1 hypothetical protein C8Q77DRAFT_1157998 [Trametes polyzona]